MRSSSPVQATWTPPPLETIEAKREWVGQLHREAALMSAQADFHLRCDLAGYHSNYHALLARLAQGLPLTQEDGARLVEQFKVSMLYPLLPGQVESPVVNPPSSCRQGLSLSYPQYPVVELAPRVLIRLSRTLKYCGFPIESCYLYLTVCRFVTATAHFARRADDPAYVQAAREAYEPARMGARPPPLRPGSQFDRGEFARLIPQVRVLRARAMTWARELDKLEMEQPVPSGTA